MSDAAAEITDAELDALIERVETAVEHELALSVEDMRLLLRALLSLAHLHDRLTEHDITVHKLRKLAGLVSASEKLKDLVGQRPDQAPPKPKRQRAPKRPKAPVEPVIHDRCRHGIEGLSKGQLCPECERGTLYKYAPASFLRFSGQTPLKCTQHLMDRLRCNTCGAYFTAEVSDEVKQDGAPHQQYGFSARALVCIHKYYLGMPLYRQYTLTQLLGTPMSASTSFDQCEQVANAGQPVMRCLVEQSANAVHYHLDDTTNRILNQGPIEKPDRKTGKPKTRSGIYTSGIIATLDEGHQAILFQTNIGHAGEWIDAILTGRSPQAPPPIIMSDALSHNRPTVLGAYHPSLCNAHGRREFVDIIHLYPDKIPWVLEEYGKIWDHEVHCRVQGLSVPDRLAYHQKHSLPVMEQLRAWGQQQLDNPALEEHSALAKAIRYYLNHYSELCAFCRLEGAQLDNNLLEATLKLIIRHRKNSLFFKTLAGAAIADVLTSLIATCDHANINPFDYLVALQRYADNVKQHPDQWLPWTYQATMSTLENTATESPKAA